MYTAASIDASAEREALALSRFYIITESPTPIDPRVELARQIETAMYLGIKPRPTPRYPRQKFIKWWESLCEAIERGQPVPKRSIELPLTLDDRNRRQAKRRKRVAKLQAISRLSPRKPITLAEASNLTAISLRRLQRLAQLGRIPAKKRFVPTRKNMPGRGQFMTTVGDVRRYLATRCAAA